MLKGDCVHVRVGYGGKQMHADSRKQSCNHVLNIGGNHDFFFFFFPGGGRYWVFFFIFNKRNYIVKRLKAI